jgi:hypothetical protein
MVEEIECDHFQNGKGQCCCECRFEGVEGKVRVRGFYVIREFVNRVRAEMRAGTTMEEASRIAAEQVKAHEQAHLDIHLRWALWLVCKVLILSREECATTQEECKQRAANWLWDNLKALRSEAGEMARQENKIFDQAQYGRWRGARGPRVSAEKWSERILGLQKLTCGEVERHIERVVRPNIMKWFAPLAKEEEQEDKKRLQQLEEELRRQQEIWRGGP